MPKSWRRLLIQLTLFLAAGAFVGWIYGRPDLGLLGAALIALVWQVRQLLAFEYAVRTRDFHLFKQGDGIWQQLFSRYSYEREQSVSDKQRYRQLLREIRKSTNAMPDGAVILDAANEIVACNRAAKKLAGLKRKKDRGQRIDNILRDPGLVELIHADDYKHSVEIASPVREGDWLNCRLVPYGADQKLLLLRDITDRIRLYRMRRDFVANASHELRSPLTVISGYLDSLADEADTPDGWEQPIKQMQIQAQRMNRIVAELLELSQLESAGPARAVDAVDVAALIAAVKKSYQGRNDVATVETNIESTVQLLGNASQIESVLTNLVSNAVRHTPADGVVQITWRSSPDVADLIVRDSGEGIPQEFIPRLTERFFRVDRGRSRDDGGVGLGLAIVKHILGRHDADLLIESTPGDGSEFRCRFPAKRIVVRPPVQLVS